MNFTQLVAVGLGGLIGSIFRFIVVKTIDNRIASVFPYGTLTVNIIGSIILGFIFGLTIHKMNLSDHMKLFLGTGFCGGFTTFSAFALENFTLLQEKPAVAILYIFISLAAGLLAVLFGVFLSKTLS